MTKDEIVRLENTEGLSIGDILGDMIVMKPWSENTPIDKYKYKITGIVDETHINIETFRGDHPVCIFFKFTDFDFSPKIIKGHKLTKMFV